MGSSYIIQSDTVSWNIVQKDKARSLEQIILQLTHAELINIYEA